MITATASEPKAWKLYIKLFYLNSQQSRLRDTLQTNNNTNTEQGGKRTDNVVTMDDWMNAILF